MRKRQNVNANRQRQNVALINTGAKLRNQSKIPNVMPPIWHSYHKYVSHVISYNPGAQTYGAFDYYLNSPFAPDVSGTDVSSALGALLFTGLYKSSLVLSARVTIEACNEEAFEICMTAAPSTTQLDPLIGSASEVMELAEMPWGKSVTLGRNSGMNREKIEVDVNLSKLAGTKIGYLGDTTYLGFGSAYPGTKFYFTVGIASVAGNNFTGGITFRYSTVYKIRWSNRIFSDIALSAIVSQPKNFGLLGARSKSDSDITACSVLTEGKRDEPPDED